MSQAKLLNIGSRNSQLAMWQAQYVQSLIPTPSSITPITTSGDTHKQPLHEIGGKGLFIREIEQALLNHTIDLGVHSLKDLPAEIPQGLILAAVLPRHSPRDLIVLHPRHTNSSDTHTSSKTALTPLDLEDLLPSRAIVATGSLRRSYLLKQALPQVEIIPLRGNVDTRIQKLRDSSWDAIIIAEAATTRLPDLVSTCPSYPLDPTYFTPSPAQGALAIETRTDHPELATLTALDHLKTSTCVHLERLILKKLGADCSMPVGIHAELTDQALNLSAKVLSPERCAQAQISTALDTRPATSAYQLLTALIQDGLNQVLQDLSLPAVGQS